MQIIIRAQYKGEVYEAFPKDFDFKIEETRVGKKMIAFDKSRSSALEYVEIVIINEEESDEQ